VISMETGGATKDVTDWAFSLERSATFLPTFACLYLCILTYRYLVKADTIQATLRGAEHRSVMHFLPFSIAGSVGVTSGPDNHSVWT